MKHDTGFGASFPCNIKLDIAINFNHQIIPVRVQSTR